MRIQKRPLRWRITGQGSGVALILVATASMAHAHGGIAGPDDLGPPLFTSAALASICYWIVILWPVSKRKGSGDAPPGEMPVGKDRRYTMRTSRKAAPRRTSQLRKVGSNHARSGLGSGGKRAMNKQLVLGIILTLSFSTLRVPQAFAHGEAGDEPFLKDLTTAFYDVRISPTEIQVGQPVTITGTVRILETWPYTLDPPSKAYITPVVPGPVFALQDRTVNGQAAPGSFFVEKGGVYEFKMVMLGRNPGRWHVHPGIAVEGTGTLIGPGEWVTVQPSVAGFTFPVTLLSGQTINLNTYEGGFVWWWSFAGFLIGVAWMFYWTLSKRTITNLAVTLQLPVNDDAPDIGLITPKDHVWMNALAGITIAMLVVGWTYMAMKYPVRLPQQTDWFAPKFISSGEKMAEVEPGGATYDDGTDTLLMKVSATNTSTSPITLKQYIMAMTTFVNDGPDEQAKAGPHDYVGQLEVEPNTPIAPGETKELTLRMSNALLTDERLIPLRDPQQFIAGLLRFENAAGKREMVTVRESVIPTQFRSQYLFLDDLIKASAIRDSAGLAGTRDRSGRFHLSAVEGRQLLHFR